MQKIEIKGAIIDDDEKWIYNMFDMKSTSPQDVNNALIKAKGEDIEVTINSPGGSVFAGSEIYTLLKDYKGNTTGKILGIAASAASVIAMGVNILKISPTAQLMIHKASIVAGGNSDNFCQISEVLNKTDKSIANAYMLKTGMKQDELLYLMGKETWLTAQEAKEKGFVDEIMFDDSNEIKLAASFNNNCILPQNVINTMKNKAIAEKQAKQQENDKLELAKAKLKLITM